MSDDFTLWFWREWAQTMGTNVADEKLLQLRKEWGGSRPYIPVRPTFSTQRQLGACVEAGMSPSDAFAAVGCSAAWGHRLLSRRLRR